MSPAKRKEQPVPQTRALNLRNRVVMPPQLDGNARLSMFIQEMEHATRARTALQPQGEVSDTQSVIDLPAGHHSDIPMQLSEAVGTGMIRTHSVELNNLERPRTPYARRAQRIIADLAALEGTQVIRREMRSRAHSTPAETVTVAMQTSDTSEEDENPFIKYFTEQGLFR